MDGPMEILENEHRYILKVVGVMTVLAERLDRKEAIDPEAVKQLLGFMRTYADKEHHGKEEDLLFTALEKRGVPANGCPLGALRHEHRQGRELISKLQDGVSSYTKGDAEAGLRLRDVFRAIAALYPNHIWKEDYLLFPMANKVLDADERRQLRQAFEKIEGAISLETRLRLEQLAEDLSAKFVSAGQT